MRAPTLICLHGPESTGKTALARSLAERFGTVWLPEFAADYYSRKLELRRLDEPGNAISVYEDITNVAIGQLYAMRHFVRLGKETAFLDTDPLATLAYSRHYFGKTPDWLEAECETPPSDFYLLTDVDTPWEPSPLRDRPEGRGEMLALFRAELEKRNAPYALVRGQGKARLECAAAAVERFLREQGA